MKWTSNDALNAAKKQKYHQEEYRVTLYKIFTIYLIKSSGRRIRVGLFTHFPATLCSASEECASCGSASTVLTNVWKSDSTRNFDVTRRTMERNMYVVIPIQKCRNASFITFSETTERNLQKDDDAEPYYTTITTCFETKSFHRLIVPNLNFRRTYS